jgi:hypothetical protein
MSALFLILGFSVCAQTISPESTKPDEATVKAYRDLMAEYQSVQTAWKDAPKKDRDEALKAWQETNGAKLRELRQKVQPQAGFAIDPLNRPIPENTPPARRAYLEALRDYQKSRQVDRSGTPLDAEAKAKIEEQKANLSKLAEAAKAEREEIESKLPEEERKKIELRRVELQKEKTEREAFFQSLKTLSAQERQAALKKWSEERKAARKPIVTQ